MKFTESRDGIQRANVRVTLRLTQEEIDRAKELAKREEISWRVWLESQCNDGLYSGFLDEDGSYEQRNGRGGD